MKKTNLKRVAALVLCAAVVGSTAACSGGGSGSGTSAGSGTTAASGGEGEAQAQAVSDEYRDTIIFAIDQEPPSMCGLTMRSTTPSYMTMMETTQMVNELVLAEREASLWKK